MRTLSRRELNRALLARQLLLERGRVPIPKALEKVGELQARYAPSTYVGSWSRVEGFERGALTAALERRTVVQGTLMRSTIHLVARRDYWPFALATRAARRASWMRAVPDAPCEREIEAAGRKLEERLAGGRLRRAEIEALLGKRVAREVGLCSDLVRVPLPDPETPAAPRFLPTWDATLLVHARRTGLLSEEHRPRIFSARNPHSFPTFLVDGEVSGTWRYRDGRIELEPFGRLDAADRRALREEAARLAGMHL